MCPWNVLCSLVCLWVWCLDLPTQPGRGRSGFLISWVPSWFPLSSSGHAWGDREDKGQRFYRWWSVLPPSFRSRWQPWGAFPAHSHDPDSSLPHLWPCGDELPPGPVPACYPGGWLAAAHHADEERPGLRVQGGIWGKRPACGETFWLFQRLIWALKPCYKKHGSLASSISITWDRVGNATCQATSRPTESEPAF